MTNTQEKRIIYSADINNVSIDMFGVTPKVIDEDIDELRSLLHTHTYIEVFVCVDGELLLATDRGSTKLSSSDIAIVPSEYSHIAKPKKGSRFLAFGMIIVKNNSKRGFDFYSQLSSLTRLKAPVIYRGKDEVSKRLADYASRSYPSLSPVPVLNFVSAIEEIMSTSEYELLCVGQSLPIGTEVEKDRQRMLILEEMIFDTYTDPLDIEGAAARLYMSRRHLDRVAKRNYGKTFKDMVYENRIELSKRILKETDSTVDEVSQLTGFSATSTFKKVFVKSVGITPGEYRRKAKRAKIQ